MPSFNRGDTLALTLDADDIITFTGTGTVFATVNGSQTQSSVSGTNTVIGPYCAAATLSIQCATAGSYSQYSTPLGTPKFVFGTSAPVDADGLPDNTIYIQTA
jgi:hypothetical protein